MPGANSKFRIPNHNIKKRKKKSPVQNMCVLVCVGERQRRHMFTGEMPKATTVVARSPWSGIWNKHLVTRWCPSCVLNHSWEEHCTALQGQKNGGMVGAMGTEMNPNRNILWQCEIGEDEEKRSRAENGARRNSRSVRYFQMPLVVWVCKALHSLLPSPSLLCDAYQFVIKPANFNYNTLEVEHFSASHSPPLSSLYERCRCTKTLPINLSGYWAEAACKRRRDRWTNHRGEHIRLNDDHQHTHM